MSRTGRRSRRRRLNRRLSRCLDRRLDSFAVHLASGRRPPPVNWLRQACRILSHYVRSRQKSLKHWPEVHPVELWDQMKREREQAALQEEWNAALTKVYGPRPDR